MSICIYNALVITEETAFHGAVVAVDGKITALHKGSDVPSGLPAGVTTIDAKGKYLVPGGIDPHVHLEYPQGGNKIYSADDFHTGSVAAVAGGTTTILDFVEAGAGEGLIAALDKRQKDAEARSVLDFSFHMSLNRGEQAMMDEVPAVLKRGVTSFKIYTAYDGIRLKDNEIVLAMETLAKHGGLPIIHAECHDLIMKHMKRVQEAKPQLTDPVNHPTTRPVQGEAEATHRVVMMAHEAQVPMGIHIVHVTAELAMPTFRLMSGAREGLCASKCGPVTGEVCAHHLALTDEVYSRKDNHDFCCAPPLRPQSDVDAMWKALKEDLMQFTVTDHCAFTKAQRRGARRTPEFRKTWTDGKAGCTASTTDPAAERWWPKADEVPPFFCLPGGLAGIENRMEVVYSEAIKKQGMSLPHYVRITSTNAAKRFGLYPKKGSMTVGADADLTLIDPTKTRVLHAADMHMNCDHCAFEGIQVHGCVDVVVVGGKVFVKEGKFLPEMDSVRGHFLARKI